MSVNIGLVIWKEMRAKSLSREELADLVNISVRKMGEIINSSAINTELLAQISTVLKVNLFDYYSHDPELSKFNISKEQVVLGERDHLLSILEDKNELLRLNEETIKNQGNTISLLEKIKLK